MTASAPPDTAPPGPPPATTPGALHRLGRWCARHARRVVVAWLLVLVAAFAADRAWGGSYEDEFSLPGTTAQRGADLLEEHGSDLKGVGAQIVVTADDGLAAHRPALDAALAGIARLPEVLT
ncbi:MMPL family transporter, partial [Streptomyces sp. NPDC059466]